MAQREYEREKREADQKEKDREQKEKDRELEKMNIEAAQKDKELELAKIKFQAAQREKDKEMEKLKIEAEVKLKTVEAETTSHPWGPKEKSSNPRSHKLPYFEEHTDKMDSYLTRFESYAISNKWDPSMSASYLSALLKGRALEVFVNPKMTSQIMVR